jgi:3-oxoacyl-[acyl-carrier protein] reductase
MELSLAGKRALVCGASQGIGRATALELASAGAEVFALARSAERLEALLPELEQAGAAGAHAVAVDLEDLAELTSTVQGLLQGGAVHVLINNSGGPPSGPLLQATPEDFLKAFQRHLLASHTLAQLLVPGMTEAGYGRIVNVISTSVREPIPNLGVSNTIRGAMASWAKTLSRELPPGCTINSVLPGFTDTARLSSLAATLAERGGTTPEAVHERWLGMVPEGRLGRPEELAATIGFLVSPAGAYVRGVCLAVDGGRLHAI